jgi:hypothetical protein
LQGKSGENGAGRVRNQQVIGSSPIAGLSNLIWGLRPQIPYTLTRRIRPTMSGQILLRSRGSLGAPRSLLTWTSALPSSSWNSAVEEVWKKKKNQSNL